MKENKTKWKIGKDYKDSGRLKVRSGTRWNCCPFCGKQLEAGKC